jgi:hypothetical protein
MPSYLSTNLNFAGKGNPFNNSKEKIIQKDEESGEEDKGFAGAENFIEPNKRSQQNFIPHERKIFYILLIGILRYFSMFHYGRRVFSGFVPEKYISPCNGTNLMSTDDIDLLKHNITHVHEELKSISVVNGYHLNNNASSFSGCGKLCNLVMEQFIQPCELILHSSCDAVMALSSPHPFAVEINIKQMIAKQMVDVRNGLETRRCKVVSVSNNASEFFRARRRLLSLHSL